MTHYTLCPCKAKNTITGADFFPGHNLLGEEPRLVVVPASAGNRLFEAISREFDHPNDIFVRRKQGVFIPWIGLNVRPARFEDLPGILEIYNHAVLHTTASYDYEPRTMEHRAKWFEDHQKQDLPVLVCEENGEVLGWSSLSRYHDRPGYRFTVEDSVYVAEGHRGKGVGKLLLVPLIDAARERKLRAIIGAIDADNKVSIRLHAKLGFEQVGHFKKVGFKFDRWLDVVYMELLL